MVQPLPPKFCRLMVQKRPPVGGEADKKTVQWTVFLPNARASLRGPGARALPGPLVAAFPGEGKEGPRRAVCLAGLAEVLNLDVVVQAGPPLVRPILSLAVSCNKL
jgi:hypothetical protein